MSDEEVPTKRRKSLIMDRSMLDFQNMIDNTEEFMEKEIEQLPIRSADKKNLSKQIRLANRKLF